MHPRFTGTVRPRLRHSERYNARRVSYYNYLLLDYIYTLHFSREMPAKTRASRTRGASSASARKGAQQGAKGKTAKKSKKADVVSEDEGGRSAEDDVSDAYVDKDSAGDNDEEVNASDLDSDAIDDSDFGKPNSRSPVKKRKRGNISASGSPGKKSNASSSSSPKRKSAPSSPAKRRKRKDEDSDDEELKDGQEVVGTVVEAPKTGQG